MIISCPDCGKSIVVNGLGRKRLNIDAKNIYNALAVGKSITTIASELKCSRAYIYSLLKETKR